MHHRQDLIRKRAHQIWNDEGCPEGRDEAHWLRAEAEIDGLATQSESGQPAEAPDLGDTDVPGLPLTTVREAGPLAMAIGEKRAKQ